MVTIQQRISLKGSETTIAHFTNLLREVKDLFGSNSAEVITNAIQHWRENGYKAIADKTLSLNLVTKYFSESNQYNTRIFHLQLLTSTDIMSRITLDVERLKRDSTLKSAIEMYGIGPYSRGGADFQLAALILVLEYYKTYSPSRSSKVCSNVTDAKKPPLPITKYISTKPSNYSDKETAPPSMQKENIKYQCNIESKNRHATDSSDNIPDMYPSRTSVDRDERRHLDSSRSHRGQSCMDYRGGMEKTEEDKMSNANNHLVSWRSRIREQQLAENRRLNESIRSSLSCSRETTPVRNTNLEEKINTFRNWRSNTPRYSSTTASRDISGMHSSSTRYVDGVGSSETGSRHQNYGATAAKRIDKVKDNPIASNTSPGGWRSYVYGNKTSNDDATDEKQVEKDTKHITTNVINYENKAPDWTPVHQLDIRKRAFENHTNLCVPGSQSILTNDVGTCKSLNTTQNLNHHLTEKDSPAIKRRYETDTNNNYLTTSSRVASEPPKTIPKLESNTTLTTNNVNKERTKKTEKMEFKVDIDLESITCNSMSFKDRKERSERVMSGYLMIDTPGIRSVPGYPSPLSHGERLRHGIDCDEVFPNIILGNGATLRKKEYLRRIGIGYILNAAESRGVNVGKEYFGDEFEYMGIRIEDTPQTQINR